MAVVGVIAGSSPFCVYGGLSMKQLKSTRIIKPHIQQELFLASPDPPANQSISVYRVSLVKDESVSFGNVRLANSQEAQA
jgi:hypothetical protein